MPSLAAAIGGAKVNRGGSAAAPVKEIRASLESVAVPERANGAIDSLVNLPAVARPPENDAEAEPEAEAAEPEEGNGALADAFTAALKRSAETAAD
jgi:hypothetical protein